MKIKKPTITLLIITIIAIATLLIGILDNSESSTAKNYFESTPLTIVPANSTNLPQTKTSPTLIQLHNPEELTSKPKLSTSQQFTKKEPRQPPYTHTELLTRITA